MAHAGVGLLSEGDEADEGSSTRSSESWSRPAGWRRSTASCPCVAYVKWTKRKESKAEMKAKQIAAEVLPLWGWVDVVALTQGGKRRRALVIGESSLHSTCPNPRWRSLNSRRLTRRRSATNLFPVNLHVPLDLLPTRPSRLANQRFSGGSRQRGGYLLFTQNTIFCKHRLYGFAAHSPLNNARRAERRLGLKLVEAQTKKYIQNP
jgi:hypothetical protein